MYRPIQMVMGALFGSMKKADLLLVSGYERTRQALRWAGCKDAKMLSVADSGISVAITEAPRIVHKGKNGDFVWIGRMDEYKGADLAIKAVAKAGKDVRLTLFGGGAEESALRDLTRVLGLEDRVVFAGWLQHSEFVERMSHFRGFVFPTLAEANGIVIQEAMGLGLPVVSLKWGGPAELATDDEAILLETADEESVVRGLAEAMDRLSADPDLAENLSQAAWHRAQADYPWHVVAASWMAPYEKLLSGSRSD